MPLSAAVLTMAKGRHEHLLNQVDGLSVAAVPPDLHVVISMGDRDLTRGRLPLSTDRWRTVVRPVPSDRRALPLAAARNASAEIATAEGAELLLFVGGDVIPGFRSLERYLHAVAEPPPGLPDGPVVLGGSLLALPELEEGRSYPFGRLAEVAAPDPLEAGLGLGELRVEEDWDRFDGRAFAMTARDFEEVGGFCGDYTGHGLEDADFVEKVRRAGGAFVRVGGATSYTQPVPPPDPAAEQRTALRHAGIWRSRWGTDPEQGRTRAGGAAG